MKHNNKYWIREKEYISIQNEMDILWDTLPRSNWRIMPNSRMAELRSKLNHKFYNEEYGMYSGAPKWYRKMRNKIQRAKSKRELYRAINVTDDYSFEDNYKDASWYW